jgi:hypothetical protein
MADSAWLLLDDFRRRAVCAIVVVLSAVLAIEEGQVLVLMYVKSQRGVDLAQLVSWCCPLCVASWTLVSKELATRLFVSRTK